MGQPCYFIFAVHNHQPVGNFDWVVEEAYHNAYLPFVETLERHPRIRVTMHFSGPLLDFLLECHAEFVARLRALALQNRIELLTSGYTEPILSVIPPGDRLGQIRKMSEAIEQHFGRRPTGLWLAERVWEPSLPESLARAGVGWCAVDDFLFRSAGVSEADCFGIWTTEEMGRSIRVIPILEKLRYTIPFADPRETFDYLRHFARDAERPLVAFVGDDGEKFGVWPGTHKHCYTDGWLERFFTQWEEALEEFPPLLPGEALARVEPLGRTYLPAGSYPELMAWSLPAAAGRAYETAARLLDEKGIRQEVRPFFRGGLWSNFLAKYPESNHIHKKMLWISGRLDRAQADNPGDITGETPVPQNPMLAEAREALWRGQCNCAYWHGLFGGLYLVHLRHALQKNINAAARLLGEQMHGEGPWIATETLDLDADGAEERVIETDRWLIVCDSREGGVLADVSWKPRDLNLCDTLARREEAYHPQVREAVLEANGEGSEHAARDRWGHLLAKQPGLARYLRYDTYRRLFAIDHLIAPETTLEEFRDLQYRELGDFIGAPWEEQIEADGREVRLNLGRVGTVNGVEGAQAVRITRTLTIAAGEDRLTLDCRVRNDSERELDALWGIEFNINLLAGDAPDRYPFVEGNAVRDRRLIGDEEHAGVREFGLVDEWMDLKVGFVLSEPARLWRCGLESVSLSERGLEGNYQGTCLMPVWGLKLAPGAEFAVRIEFGCAGFKK